MSRPPLTPGCYGSVLAAQAQSVTCGACPVQEDCFALAREQEDGIETILVRKMQARQESADTIRVTLGRVSRWFKLRKRVPTPSQKSGNARSDKLLERFAADRIDLSTIKRGSNPFDAQRFPMFHHMTAFVMQGVPFKPKDMTEYVQEKWGDGLATTSLKSEVARFASALVAAHILERKEAYILCLAA